MNGMSYSEAIGRGAGILGPLLIVVSLLGVAILTAYENHQPVPQEWMYGRVLAVSPIVDRYCAMTFLPDTASQRTFRLFRDDCQRVSVGDRVTMYREQYRHDMKGQWRQWELR